MSEEYTSNRDEKLQGDAGEPARQTSEKDTRKDEDRSAWERDLLNRLSFASINEQRRSRRWNIFFKLLIFLYLFGVMFMMRPGAFETSGKSGPHTAVIEINGVISDSSKANADTIIRGLRRAFKNEDTKGVILRINSPGGSPVQSSYVYDEIVRLREKYPEIKLYAVIVDVGASGAYYIAAAADEIYVNSSSIVGSIGVLMNGFGFVEAMDKLGVERRLMTAGENKGIMDPFTPVKKSDKEHVSTMLKTIHQQFIDDVKKGRKDRLKDDPKLFSGLFWTGKDGIELGLADALGDVDYVAREVIGEENVVDFTPHPDFFERFADRIGASMANTMGEQLGLNGASMELR